MNTRMTKRKAWCTWVLVSIMPILISACGTLQVGIETNAGASRQLINATAAALATDNARLAAEATALAQPATPVEASLSPSPQPAASAQPGGGESTTPQQWQRVRVPEAGIAFDAPGDWQRLGMEWAWMAGPPEQGGPRVGLNWNDIVPGWEETAMLPNHAVMIDADTEPADWAWGQSRTYTLEVTGPAALGGSADMQSVETHIIVRAVRRAYDFYAAGRSYSELSALMPTMQHMIASSKLTNAAGATTREVVTISTPALGSIAYTLDTDLWISKASSGTPTRVTTNGQSAEPQWSPSGQALAFRHNGDVWVMRTDTGEFYHPVEGIDALMAAWAPMDRPPYFSKRSELWVVTADGALVAFSPFMGQTHEILPQSTLSNNGQATLCWSTDGWLAWSTPADRAGTTSDWSQTLFVKSADDNSKPAQLRVSNDIRETYYQLIDWVPGTRLILAGRGLMGNSLWVDGVPLVTINADTGAINDLGVWMLLTHEAYDWHPKQPGLMVLAEGAGRLLTSNKRLAVLDVLKQRLSYLTNADTSVFEPAWSPDGKLIAYAASPAHTDLSGNGQTMERGLDGRAIHLFTLASGKDRTLTQPDDAVDGWPHWALNGTSLLYTRQSKGQTEVRSVTVDDANEIVIAAGLTDPMCYYIGCNWKRFLSYTPIR